VIAMQRPRTVLAVFSSPVDRERVWAYSVSFALLVAVMVPAFGDPAADSYPLSTYPMFARPKAKTSIAFAEGIDDQEHATRLAPDLVANGEVMQASHTLHRAIRGGPERLANVCARIARSVASDSRLSSVVRIRLAEGQFDSVGYFLGASEPETLTIHLECDVLKHRR
jgi:hypothetical protein